MPAIIKLHKQLSAYPKRVSALPLRSLQPSTCKFTPVNKPEPSEARNTHGQAIAKPVPKRLSAVELIARSWSSFVGHRTSFTPLVSIGPAEIHFTRMPYGCH